MDTGAEAAKAVRERVSTVLVASARRGRDIERVLADLYALLERERRERENG